MRTSLAIAGIVVVGVAGGCGKHAAKPGPGSGTGSGIGSGIGSGTGSAATTPEAFLTAGTPTFVVGTLGDDAADRGIAGQVALMRGLMFPTTRVVTDASALAQWPEHPVVYGGPHVNALVASIIPCLPFHLTPGKLEIGGQTLTGDDYVLITVVPAHAKDATCAGHPEFLLYAGTGTPGIAEINAVTTDQAITVADGFGPVTGGHYDGGAAVLDPLASRSGWSRVAVQRSGVAVTIALPAGVDNTGPAVDAALRGVDAVVAKLALTGKLAMTLYVHADHRDKQAATGNGGDGHAVAYARALHVVGDVAPDGLEHLVTHEATHVLASQAWGQPASPLFGEGLAVWVAGGYAGKTLADYNQQFDRTGKIVDLLGPAFRQLPEANAYPAAGLIVDALIGAVGLDAFRDHLYGANALDWDAACTAAGTTPDQLQAAVDALLAR